MTSGKMITAKVWATVLKILSIMTVYWNHWLGACRWFKKKQMMKISQQAKSKKHQIKEQLICKYSQIKISKHNLIINMHFLHMLRLKEWTSLRQLVSISVLTKKYGPALTSLENKQWILSNTTIWSKDLKILKNPNTQFKTILLVIKINI